jgi:hypothetical protein
LCSSEVLFSSQWRSDQQQNIGQFAASSVLAFPMAPAFNAPISIAFFTHAYLILYERPHAKIGFQRGFCSSLDEAEAKVEEEVRWLSRHSYTLIEAFIVDVEDITGKIEKKKRGRVMARRRD